MRLPRDIGTAISAASLMLLAASACRSKTPGPPWQPAATKPNEALAVSPAPAVSPNCPRFTAHDVLGVVGNADVTEASGLAASRKNPGVLWVHNDSGDTARAFAITPEGASLGSYVLAGASAKDWEGMAIGPGPRPEEHYLYLGDIGDNWRRRGDIVVYRVAEPHIDRRAARGGRKLGPVEAIHLTYPDAAHDAETLLVDPTNGDLFVLTKESGGNSVLFVAHAPLAAAMRLEAVGKLRFGEGRLSGSDLATGGDISPAGDAILIRTYSDAFYWQRPPGSSLASAFEAPPCRVPLKPEQQGETIAFAADGGGYYTVSEGGGQRVHYFALAVQDELGERDD